MLSKNHVASYCCFGDTDNQCRYLDYSIRLNKFNCLKLISKIKKEIDDAVEEEINNGNVENLINIGNNCKGYYYLNSIEQGYDKD